MFYNIFLLSNLYSLKVLDGQEVNYFSIRKRKSLQGALKVVCRMGFLGRVFFFLFGLLVERKQTRFWKYKLISASHLSIPQHFSEFGERKENISTCLPFFFANDD